MESSFTCPTCGGTHEGLPTDHGWQLPGDVWAIPPDERSSHAKFDSDLCQFGDRFFIRCVFKIPFNEQPAGIDNSRYHEILVATGSLDGP